jgi:hypothetical protein
MNPTTKDESKASACDPELKAETKAEDIAVSNSLFLAPRKELLEDEAKLKTAADAPHPNKP